MGPDHRSALGNQELDRVKVSLQLLLELCSFFAGGDVQDSHVQPIGAGCLLVDKFTEARQGFTPGANARQGNNNTIADLQERLQAQRGSY
jgi:hypothetical protein